MKTEPEFTLDMNNKVKKVDSAKKKKPTQL